MHAIGSCGEALFGPLGGLAGQSLRTCPRQPRAVASVVRVVSAAVEAICRGERPDAISIEALAGVAGVTPQAIYRYFGNIDDLITASLRCLALQEYERMICALSQSIMIDQYEMASLIADVLLCIFDKMRRSYRHFQAEFFGECRKIGIDGSLLISGLLCQDVANGDVRRSLDVGRIATAFSAIIAVATSPAFAAVAPPLRIDAKRMLAHLFLASLQSVGVGFDKHTEQP